MGGCLSGKEGVELVGIEERLSNITLIPRLVKETKEVYRVERFSEFLVTPRRIVQKDSQIVYRATQVGSLDHEMILSCFFYDESLGCGVRVTDRGTNKDIAVASLSWDEHWSSESTSKVKTPLWLIYTLERPYDGACPEEVRLGGSTLYLFGHVRDADGLMVSRCHASGECLSDRESAWSARVRSRALRPSPRFPPILEGEGGEGEIPGESATSSCDLAEVHAAAEAPNDEKVGVAPNDENDWRHFNDFGDVDAASAEKDRTPEEPRINGSGNSYREAGEAAAKFLKQRQLDAAKNPGQAPPPLPPRVVLTTPDGTTCEPLIQAPYRSIDAFHVESPGCGLMSGQDAVVKALDARGSLSNHRPAVAYFSADITENVQTGKKASSYDVEVASGVDAALMVLVVVIKDWEVGRSK